MGSYSLKARCNPVPETPWYQMGPPADSWPEAPEPNHATAIGPADREPVGIYLGSSAMEALERAFSSSPERAVAGFLLGRAHRGPTRPFLLVTGVAASPDRRDALEGPRFGAQALAAMERAWRAGRPRDQVVGWFHGRPKRGVALSDFDRFTHHRLFPTGWQIALFIDTERDASLLYRPDGATLVPCDNFYYWHHPDPGLPERTGAASFPQPQRARSRSESAAASEPPRRRESTPAQAGAPRGEAPGPDAPPTSPVWGARWKSGLALLLIACYLLLSRAPGSLPWLKSRAEERWESLAQRNEALDRLERERESLLRQREAASVEVGRRAVEERSVDRAAAPLLLPPPGEIEYTIRPGDTMWDISAAFTGNPLAFRDLAQRNGIANPDLIFPGQRLKLPEALPPPAGNDGAESAP